MISPVGYSESDSTATVLPDGRRESTPFGWHYPETQLPSTNPSDIIEGITNLQTSSLLVLTPKGIGISQGGTCTFRANENGAEGFPIVGILPPLRIAALGNVDFCRKHSLKYPYLTGAMANGIASAEIVEAISQAGMLGFFGAAGLSLNRIEETILRLKRTLGDKPFGFNLIHSPNEPLHEANTVELYLKHQVRLVEASAYLDLTLPVVRYRLEGIHRGTDGRIVTPNRIVAKVSRIEVASKFFAPPPERFVRELVSQGKLTPDQAELAKQIPMAEDLTAEADSGGHTDNRPAITLLPTMIALRDRVQKQSNYVCKLHVGAAGGIATPFSVAAAFAMGASYVVTGSINQACTESGSSDLVREMLAQAEQADVIMAPAADMFEMGVKVQVLKRGTMFAMRAAKLYEWYRAYPSIDHLPSADRNVLETQILRLPVNEVWQQTKEYFLKRDPNQVAKAEKDPKHQMALVFRWYLGQSSRWANSGLPERKIDYQVWCGPAMGAFNEWTKGSFLAEAKNRKVVTLALNLLYGAAILNRQNQLRMQGLSFPAEYFDIQPQQQSHLEERLRLAEE
jgi:trans-AT polyketide synthase, acyltransferase and oxidoreductase domains